MNITFGGITHTSHEWAKLVGVSESALRYRVNHWGLKRALATPKLGFSSQAGSGRKRIRNRDFTGTELAKILTGYMNGTIEDSIARSVNSSRKTISRLLISIKAKKPGRHPVRLLKRRGA